jgi:hypothetical protein
MAIKFFLRLHFLYFGFPSPENDIEDMLESVSVNDLIAMVFWDKSNSNELENEILREKREGLRDEARFL